MSQHTHIVVLNGMSGAAVEVQALALPLRAWGRVWTPDIPGHGGRPVVERFSVPFVARDLMEFLDEQGIARAVLVGFSLGGLFSLYAARHWPQRVRGVCALAAKFELDRQTSERWLYLGDPDRLLRESPRRAAELQRMHQPQDWRQVYAMNRRFYRSMPDEPAPLSDEDLRAITVPVRLVSGTADPIVTVGEQERLAKLLRTRAQIWPGAVHPLPLAPLGLIRDIGAWIEELEA